MKKSIFIIITLLFLTSESYGKIAKKSSKKNSRKDSYQAIMSTKFDFSETSIMGEMKAPDGFFLQGRKRQSLSQMVKLRSNFKRKLRNSRAAVKSLVK